MEQFLSDAELAKLTRLRRAVEYAALEYARVHRSYGPWIVGKLGLLTLEAHEVDGKVEMLSRWSFVRLTPVELTRAYQRARDKEFNRGT